MKVEQSEPPSNAFSLIRPGLLDNDSRGVHFDFDEAEQLECLGDFFLRCPAATVIGVFGVVQIETATTGTN
jgi:hypothetical protein